MRALVTLFGCIVVSCGSSTGAGGPPLTQLYFPAGLAHVDVPGSTEGVLFVANANFDKRYPSGSLVALRLDELGLPQVGADVRQPEQVVDLKLRAEQSVQIASFAGELALTPVNGGAYRLYVPTRSEGMRVYQAQANFDSSGGVSLRCAGVTNETRDCTELGVSLSPRQFEQSVSGLPRAPSPFGVAVSARSCVVSADCGVATTFENQRNCQAGRCIGADGEPQSDVYVTHLTQADSPLLSNANLRGYLVRLDSDDFSVSESSFTDIGFGGSNSVAVLGPWAYVSGRLAQPAPNLMRLVNRAGVTLATGLENVFRVTDTRSLAFSSDRKRLFIVGRVPDTLLELKVTDPDGFPVLSFLRATPLCDGPNGIAVLPRAGRGDVVVVTCSSANSVAVYDSDVGDQVALVSNIGVQPFAVAIDSRGGAARLFVSNFGDGRISVIDIPDVNRPQRATLVAHLGAQQLCLTRGAASPGCLASRVDGGVQ
jgi:hypothetical protein